MRAEWFVKGCAEWQAKGLKALDAVTTATKQYRIESTRSASSSMSNA